MGFNGAKLFHDRGAADAPSRDDATAVEKSKESEETIAFRHDVSYEREFEFIADAFEASAQHFLPRKYQ